MSKLKKMLLIGFLILLSSCGPKIPDPPEAMRVSPIWSTDAAGINKIEKFYGLYMKSGEAVEMSLAEARDYVLICTPLIFYDAEKLYLEQMRKLAEKYCVR